MRVAAEIMPAMQTLRFLLLCCATLLGDVALAEDRLSSRPLDPARAPNVPVLDQEKAGPAARALAAPGRPSRRSSKLTSGPKEMSTGYSEADRQFRHTSARTELPRPSRKTSCVR